MEILPPELSALCSICKERGSSIRAALSRANVVPVLAPYAMHRQVAFAILKMVSSHRPSRQALGGCVQEIAACGMYATRPALTHIVDAMLQITPIIRRWHGIDPSVYGSIFVMALHASAMRVKSSAELIKNIINVATSPDRSHVSGPIASTTFGSVFDISQHDAYFQVALYCPDEMAIRIGESLVNEFVTKPQLSPLLMVLAPHLKMSSYTSRIFEVATKDYPAQRGSAMMAIHRYTCIDEEGHVVRRLLTKTTLMEELTSALEDATDDLHLAAPDILLQCMVHASLPPSIVGQLIAYFQGSPGRFGFKAAQSIEQARTIVMIGTILLIPSAHLNVYSRQLQQFEEELERTQKLQQVGLDHLAPPDAFHCPVTREVMRDPVVASDGHSYERDTLVSLIQTKQRSPLTREKLNPDICVPNINLKKRIREYSDDLCDAVKAARPSMVDPLDALIASLDESE